MRKRKVPLWISVTSTGIAVLTAVATGFVNPKIVTAVTDFLSRLSP